MKQVRGFYKHKTGFIVRISGICSSVSPHADAGLRIIRRTIFLIEGKKEENISLFGIFRNNFSPSINTHESRC